MMSDEDDERSKSKVWRWENKTFRMFFFAEIGWNTRQHFVSGEVQPTTVSIVQPSCWTLASPSVMYSFLVFRFPFFLFVLRFQDDAKWQLDRDEQQQLGAGRQTRKHAQGTCRPLRCKIRKIRKKEKRKTEREERNRQRKYFSAHDNHPSMWCWISGLVSELGWGMVAGPGLGWWISDWDPKWRSRRHSNQNGSIVIAATTETE